MKFTKMRNLDKMHPVEFEQAWLLTVFHLSGDDKVPDFVAVVLLFVYLGE